MRICSSLLVKIGGSMAFPPTMEAHPSPFCSNLPKEESPPSWLGPTRTDSSLSQLTRTFVCSLRTSPTSRVELKESALKLGIAKRRIYDITNVLEGIGLIVKDGKNAVQWNSSPGAGIGMLPGQREEPHAQERLRILQGEVCGLREEDDLLNRCLETLSRQSFPCSINSAHTSGTLADSTLWQDAQHFLFVSYSDLCGLKNFETDSLVGVQYPLRTSMEVSIPTVFPSHSPLPYRLSLCGKVEPSSDSEAKSVQVHLIRPQVFRDRGVPSVSGVTGKRTSEAAANFTKNSVSSDARPRSPKRPRIETTRPHMRSPPTPTQQHTTFEGSASPFVPTGTGGMLEPPWECKAPSNVFDDCMDSGTSQSHLQDSLGCPWDRFTFSDQCTKMRAIRRTYLPYDDGALQRCRVEGSPFDVTQRVVFPAEQRAMSMGTTSLLLTLDMDGADDIDDGRSCSSLSIGDLTESPLPASISRYANA